MKKKEVSNFENYSDDVKELVKARLDVLPDDVGLSLGSKGDFSKSELLEQLEKGDEIGVEIVQIEMEFLQSLKKGSLYGQNNFDNQA